MKPTLPLLVLCCAGVPALTWLSLPEAAAVPAATAPAGAPLPAALLDPVSEGFVRAAPPVDAAQLSGPGPLHSVTPAGAEIELAAMSPAEVEQLARRYFHAVVVVEELEHALPPEQDPPPRTKEHLPGFFAAIAERDRLGDRLALAPARRPQEALPFLDLRLQPADFEKAYRGFMREDLLLEHWLLSRAVYTECARRLDERLTHGPFDTRPIAQAATFG